MSTYLIAAVGIAYAFVALEMLGQERYALALVWGGYAVAQIGLWVISFK
jgi:hypothetical protein